MKRILLICLFVAVHSIVAQAQFRRKNQTTVAPDIKKGNNLNYSAPTEYFIGGIDITGLNVLDKNALISLTGLKVGDKIKIPGTATATAVRKLWKHGLVGDVTIVADRIEDDKVYILIQLTERPRLTDFYFTGLSSSKQSSLKEDMRLIRGKIVTDAMIRNAESSVKRHFTKKGFLNIQVNIIKERDTLNRGGVRLRINVDVQSKVKIKHILFEGNQQVSDQKLKSMFKKTHEKAQFSLHRAILSSLLDFKPRYVKEYIDSSRQMNWREVKDFLGNHVKLNFLRSSKFIRGEYEEDKKKLIARLNNEGFRDAEILSDSIIKSGYSTIDLKLKVNEGKKYYFRNITWTGNFLYTSATLNKVLDIRKGDVYSQELIQKKTTFNPKGGADISGPYMDDGYLFFRVTPVEVAVVNDSIDVEMRIFEGDQAIIDQVPITGNERTSEHVIRRELSTIPGRKFSRSDLIRTQQQLSQMGYFNAQKIEPEVRPNPANGTVNIGWKVEEQSNDQVQLSGGWGGYYGFVGTVGLTFNNFSLRNVPHFKKWRPLPVGDGQKLSLQMQANGKSFQSYSISFSEPWFGGRKPNSLTVSLNHSISRIPSGRSGFTLNFDATSAYLKQSGITIGFGRRLEWPDSYFTLTHSVSYLVYQYNRYFNSSTLPIYGTTNSLTFNTTLSRNSIDNPMFPKSGSTISLSLNLTPPYSLFRSASYYLDNTQRYNWIELHKWMFDSKFYLTLIGSKKPEGRSLVLETKAHFGYIGTYNNKIGGVGPFERFLMGGAGLTGGFNSFVLGQDIIGLRGYPDNQVTPPLYALRGSVGVNGIEGGIIYNKFGMEVRYPVVTSQAATVYSFVFTEAGNNWNNYQDFNPFNLYRSAGFGARIFMPAFGLIGLNWAYGFDTLPGASNRSGQQFHFTIGQQIR
ncbi:MAG: outer membrane protein assembly factor BamA [Bacteroidetes bacterium]|nr:outer membrane protein assembly factor BamA [Bacteroidota bacterium]